MHLFTLRLNLWLIACALLAGDLQAQHTYTGEGVAGDWQDADNWDMVTVPSGSGDSAIISGSFSVNNNPASIGSLEVSDGATLDADGLSVNGILNVLSGSALNVATSLTVSGNLNVSGGSDLTLSGDLSVSGTDGIITISGASMVFSGGGISNAIELVVENGSNVTFDGSSIAAETASFSDSTIDGGGETTIFTVSGDIGFTNTTFTNGGADFDNALFVDWSGGAIDNAELGNTEEFVFSGGTTTITASTIETTGLPINIAGSVIIDSTSEFLGDVIVDEDGSLEVANGAVLTVDGTFELDADATLRIHLDGIDESGFIDATDEDVTLGGTLVLDLDGSIDDTPGNTYVIMEYFDRFGTFDSLTFVNSPNPLLFYTIAYDAGVGGNQIHITAVPEPSTLALLGLVATGMVWNVRRRGKSTALAA